MPNLEGYRDIHYSSTAQVSNNVRTLSIAAIGMIWIFKIQVGDHFQLPKDLYCPVILVFIALAIDFMQSLYSSIAWFIFFRLKENEGIGEDIDLEHNSKITWPAYILFYIKIIIMILAYYHIIRFLLSDVLWE